MIKLIYIIISIYFVLGAVGFFFINRKKDKDIARQSWIKYITYYFIINVMFFSITIDQSLFQLVCLVLVIIAFFEIVNTFIKADKTHKMFFFFSLAILLLLANGLINFSFLNSHFILFAYILIAIFDSFSQIWGQLLGKRKICPTVSPKKTYEGMLGGTLTVIISAFLLRELYPASDSKLIIVALLICISAFAGDIAASYYKRKYAVKDFSQLIPGHGGVLDRFDSLIGTGALIGYLYIFI